MDKYGIDRGGARCGYPIGVSYPPDWGERTMLLIPAIEMADGHNSQLMSMHRYPDGLRAIWYDRLADEVNMDAATLLRRIALNDLGSSKNLTSEQEKLRERLERANSALP